MAYDQGLAERLRDCLQAHAGITEKQMFGGLAFLSGGYMFVGILGDRLMARVGPAAYAQTLALPHVRPMDFTGKPMTGYVFVEAPAFAEDAQLSLWVERCLDFVHRLPAKPGY